MNGQTPLDIQDIGVSGLALDSRSGWFSGVRRLPSPNCDARPPASDIELLVVHGISLPPGEFGGDGIDRLFTNTLDPEAHPYYREIAALRVSSHLLIRRTGAVTQYVSLHDRAWHAGPSCFQGRGACNDFSVGVELEGCDDMPYTVDQYRVLATVTRLLQQHYPALSANHIVGHSDIAPDRKTDPGPAFDWTCYRTLLETRES